jgi:hypothetical protein
MKAAVEHTIRPGNPDVYRSNGILRPRRGPFAEALDCPHQPRMLVSVDDGTSTDATHAVIAAIAYSIWQRRGRAAADNWFEAERVVSGILKRRPPASHRRPDRVW